MRKPHSKAIEVWLNLHSVKSFYSKSSWKSSMLANSPKRTEYSKNNSELPLVPAKKKQKNRKKAQEVGEERKMLKRRMAVQLR